MTQPMSDECAIGLDALGRKFARDQQMLSGMAETDPAVRQLCADYGAAIVATASQTGQARVAHQFRCIAVEIEMEIAQMLSARQKAH